MVTVAALQQELSKVLGVKDGEVEYNPMTNGFVCKCPDCGKMKLSGNLVGGLYTRNMLEKLTEAHEQRKVNLKAINLAIKSGGDYKYINPGNEIIRWLHDEGVDVSACYRIILRRHDIGSATILIWEYLRNEQGYFYVDAKKGQLARRGLSITVTSVPKFVDKDLYGFPLGKFDDDNKMPPPC